jgi:hypothetical protein
MNTYRYCGRDFSEDDLARIRAIIADHERYPHRYAISLAVCAALDWRKPNGTLKDMSCRVALLRMQADGLIAQPPSRHTRAKARLPLPEMLFEPEPIHASLSSLGPVQVRPIASRQEGHAWRELMDQYHYLGYTSLPGAQIRYVAESRSGIVALLAFGASAWKVAPRDDFIGWTSQQREQGLHLIVNNARFLIPPWIHVPHLASHVLAAVARRLPDDWFARYAYRPVLLETFVEIPRFKGTCYKAANWIYVGTTQGRGKLDVHKLRSLPPKDIYLYPLTKDFRQVLERS